VNPVGPRSVYDEAKRFAEALVMAHHRTRGANVGIVRIFNTYGPRLRPLDGRVVSNFVAQAIKGQPLTIYGSGKQTRSFCYVDDLVEGLRTMLQTDITGPINLGSPHEMQILQLAQLVRELTGSASPIVHHRLPADDPRCRCPDISQAAELLGWSPQITPTEGLVRTIEWYRSLTTSRAAVTGTPR
jgi:dTDP-glucose 4,6-dehydratase